MNSGSFSMGRRFVLVAVLVVFPFHPFPADSPPSIRFVDVLEGSGIDFRHHFFPSEQGENYRMNMYDHGSGVLLADVNGDGLIDIYLLDFLGPNALYLNRGNFKFENVAQISGVAMPDAVSVGGCFGDYDNDGDSDLYVTTYHGGNRLFRNRGNGTFEDVTKNAGVGHVGHSSAALWFDYDLDGDLDLFVSNVGPFTVPEPSPDAPYARRGVSLPLNYIMANPEAYHKGEPSILYRNNGNGAFTEVTKQAGVTSSEWNGDATAGDYDLDGDPDLYVSNMFGANRLFRNNGNGTFSEVTRAVLGRTSWGAMGALFFDATNDGYPDLYVVDMHSDMWTHADPTGIVNPGAKYDTPRGKNVQGGRAITRPDQTRAQWVLFGNTFFVNRRNGTFEDRSGPASLENFWPWGVVAGDFDNDGWQDIFVPAGMGYPYVYWPNLLLINNGKGAFENFAEKSGIEPPRRGKYIEGLKIKGQPFARSSRSAAAADFDQDGDLDLIINNFNHEPYLFRNDSPRNHYLQVRLEPQRGNRDGYGTKVKLMAGGTVQYREACSSGGYLTQSSPIVHFGLGKVAALERIEVTWLGAKTTQVVSAAKIDSLVTIIEK